MMQSVVLGNLARQLKRFRQSSLQPNFVDHNISNRKSYNIYQKAKNLTEMTRCKRCGREMLTQREGFCSLFCYNLDLQEQISSIGKAGIISSKKGI